VRPRSSNARRVAVYVGGQRKSGGAACDSPPRDHEGAKTNVVVQLTRGAPRVAIVRPGRLLSALLGCRARCHECGGAGCSFCRPFASGTIDAEVEAARVAASITAQETRDLLLEALIGHDVDLVMRRRVGDEVDRSRWVTCCLIDALLITSEDPLTA
jgi:hypothetical protein